MGKSSVASNSGCDLVMCANGTDLRERGGVFISPVYTSAYQQLINTCKSSATTVKGTATAAIEPYDIVVTISLAGDIKDVAC